MTRLMGMVAAVALVIGACGDDDGGDAAAETDGDSMGDRVVDDTTDEEDMSSGGLLTIETVVADLGGADLCSDPVPGDPEVEALGSLVPTGVSRCTTAGGSDVTIFAYPSGEDATEAAAIAFDFACSVEGGDAFSLLVSGAAVVQIDSTETGEGLSITTSDQGALASAQGVLGGSVESGDC